MMIIVTAQNSIAKIQLHKTANKGKESANYTFTRVCICIRNLEFLFLAYI